MSHDYFEQAAQLSRASAHAVLSYEAKAAMEFGEPVTLYEGHCRCGFKSFWHSYEEAALDAVRRHIVKAERAAYGHPTSMHTGRG